MYLPVRSEERKISPSRHRSHLSAIFSFCQSSSSLYDLNSFFRYYPPFLCLFTSSDRLSVYIMLQAFLVFVYWITVYVDGSDCYAGIDSLPELTFLSAEILLNKLLLMD